MNVKAFLGDALASALELGLATPDDVLHHVTPDVLAQHLPRPLWARLLTACLGAPRVDGQLVIDTLGVPNLCEHVPAPVLWACMSQIGGRALGLEVALGTPPPHPVVSATPLSITSPPPPEPVKEPEPPPPALGPSIPAPGSSEPDDRASRPRSRFRPSSTGIGRLAASSSARRPQAQAPAPVHDSSPRAGRSRRAGTEVEADVEVEVEVESPRGDDWRSALSVEDEQLVDWSAAEETQTSTGDNPRFGRRR